ncbi:MAG: RHS repeat-associated core domain-containing protein [Candidatus Sulfotelmatobacter sp.]
MGLHGCTLGFQGSYSDPSGLTYLINRYYDPATDQFLSVDPDVETTNQPYAFTNDDPLNAEDPLGLEDLGLGSGPPDFGVGGNVGSPVPIEIPRGTGYVPNEIPGLSSDYNDVTAGRSMMNVSTNVTPEEFGENLKDSGWKESTNTKGTIQYTKDGAKYSVYPKSSSTSGPTAEYTPAGATRATLKIRLGR